MYDVVKVVYHFPVGALLLSFFQQVKLLSSDIVKSMIHVYCVL